MEDIKFDYYVSEDYYSFDGKNSKEAYVVTLSYDIVIDLLSLDSFVFNLPNEKSITVSKFFIGEALKNFESILKITNDNVVFIINKEKNELLDSKEIVMAILSNNNMSNYALYDENLSIYVHVIELDYKEFIDLLNLGEQFIISIDDTKNISIDNDTLLEYNKKMISLDMKDKRLPLVFDFDKESFLGFYKEPDLEKGETKRVLISL